MTDTWTFDRASLDRRFGAVERLNRSTWLQAIVNSHGGLVVRLDALARMRAQLVAGRLALESGGEWPDDDVCHAFVEVLTTLGIPALCRARESIADEVLRSLLWHIDLLAALQRRVGRAEALRRLVEGFRQDWISQRADLEAVLAVFDLPDDARWLARWSELRGVLRDHRWQSLIDIRGALEQLPGLQQLIARLGRAADPPDAVARSPEWVDSLPARPRTQWRDADAGQSSFAVETHGIERAGDLQRIVASEARQWLVARPDAVLPGGPQALRARRQRRLFLARLAEHSLLCHEPHQPQLQVHPRPAPLPEAVARQIDLPRPRAGPMLICIDTSASMSGAPERVAKAVALEAMRCAMREHRACFLIAFSGPGDLRELELAADPEGILRLVQFLSESFHGGTEFGQPLERALERVAQGAWQRADLLLASDGEFGLTGEVLEKLDQARASLGLRVQAVLVGDRETIGLREVADSIFWVRDWRRFGDCHGQALSPVHDSRLTGLFFPNASMRPPRPEAPSSGPPAGHRAQSGS